MKSCLGCLFFVLALIVQSVYGQGFLAPEEILERMEQSTGALEDMTATVDVAIYRDGEVSQTQKMVIYLKQPNQMRQEYIEPAYLSGNLSIIVGNVMWIYIAATEQWLKKDLSTLSGQQQPWMMFRNVLHDVHSELDNYAFQTVDVEGTVYHLRGAPVTDSAIFGRLDIWIDTETFLPQRRIVYDVDGRFILDTRFLEPTQVNEILWIPKRIENYDGQGILQSVLTYEEIELNTGLSEALFRGPEGTDG